MLFSHHHSPKGIFHLTSCIYTSQRNEVVERKNCHFLKVTLAFLCFMHDLERFWSDVILTAWYLINCMLSFVLNCASSFSLLFSSSSQYSLPKFLAMLVMFITMVLLMTNLTHAPLNVFFLGYFQTRKGYQHYNFSLRCYFVSVDVTFDESTPYFSTPNTSSDSPLDLFAYPSHIYQLVFL